MSTRQRPHLLVPALIGLAILVAGCATTRAPLAPDARAPARDRIQAEELCDRADPLLATDPDAAEALLREAIAADPFCARARNNLGTILLARGDLFEAATEFDLARRLMPENPDPRINLGLTLEHAGRIDEALDAYTAALELSPTSLAAAQALARAQLRHARTDDRTDRLLADIALRAGPAWRDWAIRQRQHTAR